MTKVIRFVVDVAMFIQIVIMMLFLGVMIWAVGGPNPLDD